MCCEYASLATLGNIFWEFQVANSRIMRYITAEICITKI